MNTAPSFDVVVRPWADLVFHVLAHVPSSTPASVYDPVYTAFAARHLGAPELRALGEDVRALLPLATEHGSYAAIQNLAWLFSNVEEAARFRDRELASLETTNVSDGRLLAALRDLGPAVEVLRCAAELEAEAHARLPPIAFDAPALAAALEGVTPAAPALAGFRIGVVRSLRLRGRVRSGEIWLGAPCPRPGPDLAHVAWQAAHEATVAELGRALATPAADDRPLEHAALVVLAERAARAGFAEAHAAWFAGFGLARATLDPASLQEPWRALVGELLAEPNS
jgi:hypothetical protein